MLALSTAWYENESAPVSETIQAGLQGGFTAFELGISPNPKDIEKIQQLADSGEIEVISIHNIFPPSAEVTYPDRGDDVASLDEKVRRRAIENTIATVQFAERLKAHAVIIHAGEASVENAKEKNRRICSGVAEKGLTPAVKNQVKDLYRERNELSKGHIEAVIESLREVLESTASLPLGVESRYFYHQIPSIDELDVIFDKLDSDRVFYWHDMGHSQMDEFLGVCTHEDWLQRYGDRMLGMHLHDVVGASDHTPPGSGELDFEMVKRYLCPATIKVLEINHVHTMQEILEGVKVLNEIGIE